MTSRSDTISPERWQQIDTVFQAAVELELEQRAAYLDRVCQSDHLLREKVETMLAADDHGWQWMEESVVEVAAPWLLDEEPQFTSGQNFSHYEIEKMIGKGGMGEVYLAADKLLNRKVALKLLPADYTRDQQRLRRFQQEAQAASALNHPNILTIHELREADGRQYIATEFVDGETLRQRLKRTLLTVSEALDIAIQIASALAAAHQAGIVHRDLKPENVMIRSDGYVKVLDFGLAKLIEQYEPPLAPRPAEKSDLSSGLLLGTVKYMSPEQARGLNVDARSDVFSFGAVLYEMIAARAPFSGEATKDLVAAIAKEKPPPLGNAPAELQNVIDKALHKEKEERYQTVDLLLVDLKRLKENLDLDSRLHVPDRTLSEPALAAHSDVSTARVPRTETISTATSIEYLLSGIKQHRSAAGIVMSILAISTLAIGYLIYRPIGPKHKASSQSLELSGLTTSGNIATAAISPDGKYVAYINGAGMWRRDIATNDQAELIPGGGGSYWGLEFSPDGNYLYYFANLKNDKDTPALFRVPIVGGTSTRLIGDTVNSNGNDRVTFSPDGGRLAFVREYDSGETALILANADGTDERKLATRQDPPSYFGSAAWSPDGKKIACRGGYGENNTLHKDLVEIGVDDGIVKPIATREFEWIGDIAWVRDAALLITAREPGAETAQVWKIDYPSGDFHRITADLNSYAGLSLTRDSGALVALRSQTTMNIWTQEQGDPIQAKQITAGAAEKDGMAGIGWTPDDRIVYSSNASGRSDIWIMNADGSNAKQLTHDLGTDRNGLSVSPNGRYIVFVSDRNGRNNIWRVDIDGSNPKQLTNGPFELNPVFSPDGQWVQYNSGGRRWKVPIDGGETIEVTGPYASLAPKPKAALGESPDGKLVAYYLPADDQTKVSRIGIAGIEGADPIRIFNLSPGVMAPQKMRWAPNSRAITYINVEGGSNIWTQSLDGGSPQKLTDFKANSIFNFAWSRDGKQLAIVRQIQSNDVVLMRGF